MGTRLKFERPGQQAERLQRRNEAVVRVDLRDRCVVLNDRRVLTEIRPRAAQQMRGGVRHDNADTPRPFRDRTAERLRRPHELPERRGLRIAGFAGVTGARRCVSRRRRAHQSDQRNTGCGDQRPERRSGGIHVTGKSREERSSLSHSPRRDATRACRHAFVPERAPVSRSRSVLSRSIVLSHFETKWGAFSGCRLRQLCAARPDPPICAGMTKLSLADRFVAVFVALMCVAMLEGFRYAFQQPMTGPSIHMSMPAHMP